MSGWEFEASAAEIGFAARVGRFERETRGRCVDSLGDRPLDHVVADDLNGIHGERRCPLSPRKAESPRFKKCVWRAVDRPCTALDSRSFNACTMLRTRVTGVCLPARSSPRSDASCSCRSQWPARGLSSCFQDWKLICNRPKQRNKRVGALSTPCLQCGYPPGHRVVDRAHARLRWVTTVGPASSPRASPGRTASPPFPRF